MENKVLVVIRVSTVSQEIETQKSEMIDYLMSMGYCSDEMEFLEGVGASAVKLNSLYMSMVTSIEKAVDDGCRCIAVWHINRLGRNESVLMRLKELFLKNKVQFLCKNPSIQLLNPDGTVNSGADLAFSLFATMSRQDDDERKAKFKRAKKVNSDKGKYNGGIVKFGYRVDERGFLVPDEAEAKIVQDIFTMYASGNYSTVELCKELRDRGVIGRMGKPISLSFLQKCLADETYIGRKDRDGIHRTSVPIISKAQFEEVKAILEKNTFYRGGGNSLLHKLLICPVCGGTFSSNGPYYCCVRHLYREEVGKNKCPSGLTVRGIYIESALWWVAATAHMDWLIENSKTHRQQTEEKIDVNEAKVRTLTNRLEGISDKKVKIADAYIEGLFTKEDRDSRLQKVDEEAKEIKEQIKTLEGENSSLRSLLSSFDDEEQFDRISKILIGTVTEIDEKEVYNILHLHISRCVIRRATIKGFKGFSFEVERTDGHHILIVYLPRRKNKFYRWDDDEGAYVPVPIEIRDFKGKTTPHS